MKTKRINISLEPWLDEQLCNMAKSLKTNRSGLIRVLFQEADWPRIEKATSQHITAYQAPTSHNVQDVTEISDEIERIFKTFFPKKHNQNIKNAVEECISNIKYSEDFNYVNKR